MVDVAQKPAMLSDPSRFLPATEAMSDAVGLGLFTAGGTQIALDWHAPWLVASLLGVITGVVGGVLRDVLCNQVPLIFVRGELYASAAWAGALALIGLQAAWQSVQRQIAGQNRQIAALGRDSRDGLRRGAHHHLRVETPSRAVEKEALRALTDERGLGPPPFP
mgnify:CR=1 FL=1